MTQRGFTGLNELMDGTMIKVPLFLHIAIALVKLVDAAHTRNAVIRYLNPAAIRIDPETKMAIFGDNLRPDYAYLSPEQTGRMNHVPDERIDLYALGVMYYQMLAGQLPLQAQSAEAWAHAHLAIVPRALQELRPDLVGPLNDIVMKLLAKAPEHRYQSARGLLADLNWCVALLLDKGEIISFDIAGRDVGGFRLPRTLFGRKAEEEELHSAFERARTGESAFVFVTGPAGIGKTALISQLQMPVVREEGRFITGKCNVMNHDAPFSPILEALRGLIRQIWSESPDRVAAYRVRLSEVLGHGAGVIAALLPEAAKLLGELPAVESLPPAEALNRLRRLLSAFIRIFADKRHPLVMVLDDLQWADEATLDVLRSFVHDPTLEGLLVVGAYRTETAGGCLQESGVNHATAASWIEKSLFLRNREAFLTVRHIVLEPLSYADVVRFTSIFLNDNTERSLLLAAPLFQKTGGNPLYLHRLLDSLYREKKLYYVTEKAYWLWDEDAVKEIPENPDVLHLIAVRLHKLPIETLRLIGIGAAIGHRFRAATIARVGDRSLDKTLEYLRHAEEEGLLWSEASSKAGTEDARVYIFSHDRVQQAAYECIPESDKTGWHLKIGRAMRQKDESIFDTVYHLNLGCGVMVDDAEKRELAEYNLQAGLKSKASTAFAAALHYLQTGLDLLVDDKEGEGALAYRLMLELPECEYMCGRTDRAEELLDRLMSRSTGLVERSRIYLIRIVMNAYLKRDEIAVLVGLEALAEFGWNIAIKPSGAAIVWELTQTQWALFRNRDKLLHLSINRDPVYTAFSALVMAMAASVFIHSPELSAILYPRFVRYGLKHGNNEAFAFMLAAYGMISGYIFKRYNAGLHLTQMAYHLSESFKSTILKCRLHFIMGLVEQYRSPEKAVEHLEQSVRYGLESAELTFAGFSMGLRIVNHTGDLRSIAKCLCLYQEKSQGFLDEITLKLIRIAHKYIAGLQGEPGGLDEIQVPVRGANFNETHKNQAYYYCICQMETAYLAANFREVLKWADNASLNTSQQSPFQMRKLLFYKALSLAALYSDTSKEEQTRIRAAIADHLRAIKKWCAGSWRISATYLIIAAEFDRINGNWLYAVKGYEVAIRAARTEGFVLLEAIAIELAAASYRTANMLTASDALLADACLAYATWGALVKVQKLQKDYPQLSKYTATPKDDVTLQQNAFGVDDGNENIREATLYTDIDASVLRQAAGQPTAVSGKCLLEQFVESSVRYVGAHKGYVLKGMEGAFYIEAAFGIPETEGEQGFATSVVYYVAQTGEPVILMDASLGDYSADPYIRRQSSKSILCISLPYPGRRSPALLYLENNLVSGVFSKDRLAVLEMLFSRMVYLESLDESHSKARPLKEQAAIPRLDSANAMQHHMDPLTNRESHILHALAAGLSNKEIAQKFGLTEGTVKSHVFHLYGKLGVQRRTQAIVRARELQLLQ